MIGSKKYIKYQGVCSKCGLKFDNVEEAEKHEDIYQLGHIVKGSQSFDTRSYVTDLVGRCQIGIKKLK